MQKGFSGILILVGVLAIIATAGSLFYQIAKQPSSDKSSPSIPPLSDTKCVVGGCSGQLCLQVIEEQEDQVVSTCEWKEEYACYKTAKCERQKDGKCGWTKTEELNKCLQEKSQ